MNLYSIIYHYKSYTVFKIAKIVTRSDKCFKSWNICMSHCNDHRNRVKMLLFSEYPNIPQIRNIQIYAALDGTFGHFNTENNHWDIEIRTN